MRLIQLEHDWKAYLDEVTLKNAIDTMIRVGFTQIQVYNVPQDNVDSHVYFFCSEYLTPEQIQQLWEGGDLGTGDKEYWDADDFPQLLEKIKEHCKEVEDEAEELQEGCT